MDIAVCVRLVYCTLYNCAYKWGKTNLYRITYYLYIHAFEYTHKDKDTFIKWNHTVSWESELWCSEIYQEKNQIKAHFFTLQLIVFVFVFFFATTTYALSYLLCIKRNHYSSFFLLFLIFQALNVFVRSAQILYIEYKYEIVF